jgi:uncharacterized protein (TIGR01777 family)
MEVAISGASGLIGTALARSLRRDGHAVRPLVRRSPAAAGEIRWDPAGGTIDGDALDGVDAVVHLAGAGIGDKRWSPERKRELLESRTRGTDLLARTLATLPRPPRVLVSGSAIGFYGDRGDEVLTESSEPGDDFIAGLVQAWEAAAQPAVDAGIRTVLLRGGVVLSTEGGALPKMLPLFRLFLGGRMGSGRQWWSWVSIDDEVGAIRFVIDHGEIAGPVNSTAPAPVTNAEFTDALGSALHRPTFVPVPKFGPRLVVGRELADALLFVSQRVLPGVLSTSGYEFAHPDIAGALDALLGPKS